MSVKLQAPYPNIETTSYLPSPAFNDARRSLSEVFVKRAMNGTPYSYKNDLGNKKTFSFSFKLTRMKALEVEAFFKLYGSKQWQLTNFDGEILVGFCKTNPLRFVHVAREVDATSVEAVTLDFEFETTV